MHLNEQINLNLQYYYNTSGSVILLGDSKKINLKGE